MKLKDICEAYRVAKNEARFEKRFAVKHVYKIYVRSWDWYFDTDLMLARGEGLHFEPVAYFIQNDRKLTYFKAY